MDNKKYKEEIYRLTSKPPKGKISSYGSIAKILGIPARIVGFILSGMSSEEMKVIPWHRVVNKDGFISSSKLGDKGLLQEALLKSEGIEVKEFQIIDKEKYWYYF